jgi:hypothetical protein
MQIKIFYLTLQADSRIPRNPEQLRGFFATHFNEYGLLHQHQGTKFIYKYPLIQYRILGQKAIIIGIEEGATVLNEIYSETGRIKLGNIDYSIVEKSVRVDRMDFGISQKIYSYKFLTPWIALNQENYQEYQLMTYPERKEKLRSILIGNIISASKGLNYHIEEQIKLNIIKISTTPCTLKKTSLIGFNAEFMVNFDIPQYLGLGKSVSRGFGATEKLRSI